MDSEKFLTTLLKDSLVDAGRIAREHWGTHVDQVAVSALAAALFTERARVGSAALERAVLGKALPKDDFEQR